MLILILGVSIIVLKSDCNQYLEEMISVICIWNFGIISDDGCSGKSKQIEAFKNKFNTEYTDDCILHINFNLSEQERTAALIC